jgi:hypothetical protein
MKSVLANRPKLRTLFECHNRQTAAFSEAFPVELFNSSRNANGRDPATISKSASTNYREL